MSKPFDLKFIPFSQLHISELNMRHSETAPEIDDILPSVKERGIRQPLIVRREGGTAKKPKYGIVAGRRRYFCLASLSESGVEISDVPCCIMDAKDDALAIETSIIENVARLAPTEMEQYEAFKVLSDKGQSVDDIAAVFGITTNSVKRRLALGALIPDVREAYTNQQIDAASIRVLTMATEEQQADWIALFNSDDYCPTGQQLKAWLTGGGVITTDKALFDVGAYSGTILTDLFGEHGQFADVEHFWESQNAWLVQFLAVQLSLLLVLFEIMPMATRIVTLSVLIICIQPSLKGRKLFGLNRFLALIKSIGPRRKSSPKQKMGSSPFPEQFLKQCGLL